MTLTSACSDDSQKARRLEKEASNQSTADIASNHVITGDHI